MADSVPDNVFQGRFPMHDRLSAVEPAARAINEFLDDSGYVLAKYVDDPEFREPVLLPVTASRLVVLAKYFDIDLNVLNEEERVMLEELRAQALGGS